MYNLSHFFFKSLPDFFHHNDSYKNGSGEGFLQRYLSVFEDELKEALDIINKKDGSQGLSTLVDPLLVPEEFLSLLGAYFGNPPKISEDIDTYRLILKNIASIYKHRGRESGVVRFFASFGIEVEIVVLEFITPNYDNDNHYDDDELYDATCILCREYNLVFQDPSLVLQGVGILENPQDLEKVMQFLMPINAILINIIYNGDTIGVNDPILTEPPPPAE